MPTGESSVVLVLPDDDINAILEKVRRSGTPSVQLLVPEGISALQSPEHCQALRRSLDSEHIGLMVISSDRKTLQTASENQLDTIILEGTSVALPGQEEPASAAPATDGLPMAPPAPPPSPAAEMPDDYDDFAAQLDSWSDMQPGQTELPDDYDDFAAQLDSWSDMQTGQPAGESPEGDDAFAAELDSLDDLSASPRATPAEQPASDAPTQPRRRIRPEDIVLSDEEKQQASSVLSGGGRSNQEAKKKRSTPSIGEFRRQAQERQKKRGLSIPLLITILVLLAVLAAVFFFRSSRAAVTLVLPEPQTQEIIFTDQPVLIARVGSDSSELSVQAEPITTMAEFTETGQVSREIQAPGEVARGTLFIVNEGLQPLTLPEGTEFIATNDLEQDVHFVIDEPVTIPPASTVRQGLQVITTFGQAQVEVSARAPGSNSNVAANTVDRLVIPGQAPFLVNAGTIRLTHEALEGGSERAVRIVRESDVQNALGRALTGLHNQARQNLQLEAQEQGLSLEPTTMYPNPSVLSAGQGFEKHIVPPIGEEVEGDPPFFSVAVSGEFSGLATPPGQSLKQQLDEVVPNELRSVGILTPGLSLTTVVSDWQWDGSRLTVDGILEPSSVPGDLDEQTRTTIRHAIRGKTPEEARHRLDQFRQQGIISGYDVPSEQETLPTWDFLLTLEVVPSAP